MKRRGRATEGLRAATSLPQQGRARRAALDGDAAGRELWSVAASDEALADRLLALGQAGVGGFVDGGVDDEGVWLVRLAAGESLARKLRSRSGPWPWSEAAPIAIALAKALAACEKASLFPGALSPDVVLFAPAQGASACFLADGLVAALVGAPRSEARTLPAWTPPEQADGAVWDGAANRWVLGAMLYRLLAGAEPFPDAVTRRDPPPFEDAVATTLPSGLQSFALRLLDPDRARRPKSASAIAEEIERFQKASGSAEASGSRLQASGSGAEIGLQGRGSRERSRREPPEPKPEVSPPKPVARSLKPGASPASPPKPVARSLKPGAFLSLWPLGAGLLVAAGAISLLAPAPAKPKAAPIAEVKPLAEAETAATDCAACHARQASEWRRSVMAHAVKSPLFNALESLIEEQVGRDFDCPNGAGILRRADPTATCRDRQSGLPVTGSGGEHWCVNCHSPAENVSASMPTWDGRAGGDPRSRRPVRDLLGERPFEGISCGFCHQVHGPVGARGSRGYQGNPTWTSTATGAVFPARPEDNRGLLGIANSGYDLRPEDFLIPRGRGAGTIPARAGEIDPFVHRRPEGGTRAYLRSSEFCGSCHDVRLFGTDSLGASKGEHFKRLRNAYSEWVAYSDSERRAGREAATCQGCHMSSYPGTCEPSLDERAASDPECPPGSRFVAHKPGQWPRGRVADNSPELRDVVTHYFSGVDVPLSREFPDALVDEPTVDLAGIPLSARKRRDLLLRHTFRFGLGSARRLGSALEIPVEVENTGAGHRVPAGFSQEREFWVHLRVKDGDGRLVYEVGKVDRGDEDLHDKVMARVNTSSDVLDRFGRPEGVFGADVRDGPDVPQWSPSPIFGGTSFRGRGLINFQNGFLRCVRCIGTIGLDGRCQALPGQDLNRADRFADGDYDQDTGECRSNLTGLNAFLETYFPVGALDATRGLTKGPDAIIDTRSLPNGVPVRYTYDLPTGGRRGPFRIEARLLFRAFPPYLVRGFAAYEREMARKGARPSGPLVSDDMLRRLEVVELGRASAEVQ